jgi:two-component system, NarL family, nitrate/nitrite response regulator NarL
MPTGAESQGRPISVLVGENTRMHSQLLAEAISHDRGLRVIGAVSTPTDFLSAAARRKPDVAVLSACLGEDPSCGLATLRQFHVEYPQIPVVVLLDSSRRELVLEAFRSGARGIFSKNESLEQLRKCVRSVHLGQVWANSSEVRFALDALSAAPTIRAIDARGLEILSARELEVVQHLADGLTNRAIGERMGLSPHTIKNYVLRIFEKLGVSNRVELLKLTLLRPAGAGRSGSAGEPSATSAQTLWCQNFAEQGLAYAQLLLAEICLAGEIVPRDLTAAYYWYCLCEKTNPEAFALVRSEKEKLAAKLSPEQVDLVRARIAGVASTPGTALKAGRESSIVHNAKENAPAQRPRVAFGD